ncbi:MAG: hypothetical protein WBI20_02585 [Burkholderiaceae bacterium]
MSLPTTSPFKRGDTLALSGIYRDNGVAVALTNQVFRSQLRTSVGALIANLVAVIDADQSVNPGRFYLALADPELSATLPAPANLYCDVEVHDGGTVRSTETFIVPVVPDVSRP